MTEPNYEEAYKAGEEILHNWVVYSNLIYLLPFMIGLYFGYKKLALFMLWLMVISAIHHLDASDKFFAYLDITDCAILSLICFFYFICSVKYIFESNSVTEAAIGMLVILLVIFVLSIGSWLVAVFAKRDNTEGVSDPDTSISTRLFEVNPTQAQSNKPESNEILFFDYKLYHIVWHLLSGIGIALLFVLFKEAEMN